LCSIKIKFRNKWKWADTPLGKPEAPGRYEGTLPTVGVVFNASVAFVGSEGLIEERGTAVGLVEAREKERAAA
jgi:hypothetical protein